MHGIGLDLIGLGVVGYDMCTLVGLDWIGKALLGLSWWRWLVGWSFVDIFWNTLIALHDTRQTDRKTDRKTDRQKEH